MVKLSSNPTCVLSDADVLTNEQAERIAKVLTRHLPGANNVTESGKLLGVNAEGDVVLVEDNSMPSSSGASQGDVLTVGDNGPEWASPSGGGYTPVDLQTITAAPYNIPVGNRQDVAVTLTGYTRSDLLTIQLSSDCTDAVVKVNAVPGRFSGIQVMRGSDTVTLFGAHTPYFVRPVVYEYSERVLITTNEAGESGYEVPTSFDEVDLPPGYSIVGDIDTIDAVSSDQPGFLIEIKGRNAILHVK